MVLISSVINLHNSNLYFSKYELSKILSCYSLGVSKGNWKDYAIHFSKNELQFLRNTFKRLKIGIAINPENFNMKYLKNIKKIINVIYYDMNVYKAKRIKTYALVKCLKQIQYIKNLSIPVFIGGGINEKKAKEIINLLKPEGIDVSRSLKNSKNVISSKKLKNFLKQVTVV